MHLLHISLFTFLNNFPLLCLSSSSLITFLVPRQSLCGKRVAVYSKILSSVYNPGCSDVTSLLTALTAR